MVDPKNPVETLEFIDALLSGWKMHNEVMEDGKINYADIPTIIAKLPAFWKGFIGIDVIDDEMANVDADGEAKIKAKIQEFVLDNNADLEFLIEEVMELILTIVGVAKKFIKVM